MSRPDLNNTVFTFFGPPGSGKGTLARRCEELLNFSVLSTGDLCRKHIAEKTTIGLQFKDIINSGRLISDDLITKMVIEWLEAKLLLNKPIILDGFPRTGNQYDLFKKNYDDKNYTFSFRVILFEIPDNQVVDRLSNRLVCSKKDCQAVFSLKASPSKQDGICDYCNSHLEKRDDDREEVIKERLKVFADTKTSLIERYGSLGQQIERLDVSDLTKNQVFENFKRIL